MAPRKKEIDSSVQGLDLVVAQIKQKFGEGAVFQSEDGVIPGIKFISTGCKSLDKALGGGIPEGRIIEIYGQEAGGKTTLCLHICAEAQKLGKVVAYIDAEHALDLGYAQAIGVDVQKLLFCQPDSGEQALEEVDLLARSNQVGVIVTDSVAALTPQAELEGEMSDNHVGLQARMMSKAMRKINGVASKSNCTVIFINQLRSKIGVMYGNPETTSGGNALKFYASQRLDIRRCGKVGTENNITAINSRVKIVKNKVAPPFKEVEFEILFGQGINWAQDLLQQAVEAGIVQKGGAWYSMNGEQLGCGSQTVCEKLRSDKDLVEKIKGML